ncbi:GAF domain-containing protein, partial [Natrarchaeobius oligotrophus]
ADWYRTLLGHSSDAIVVLDDEYRITATGPTVESAGPYGDEKRDGARVLDPIHSDDQSRVLDALDSLRDGQEDATTVEYRCRRDDRWRVYEATFTDRFGDGVVEGIVGSIRDVTASRQVERELEESLERVTDAFFALDTEWRFTYLNDQAVEDVDLDRSDLLGRSILEVFPTLEDSVFHRESVEALETQTHRTVEGYFEPYDAWIEARIYPSPTGISVYWRDVTERIEREWKLDERTERLEALIENVPVGLFALDADGTITFAEGRALENLAVDLDGLAGESIATVFDDQPAIRADLRASLEGYPIHTQRRLKDRVFEAWSRPITTAGTVERTIGIAVDVTDRVHYQETLNALHEATSHLLTVESKADACEYIVDVAADVLDLEAVVYRFDERDNELVPAAHSPGIEQMAGSPPRLRPRDGSITWNSFVSDSPRAFDDVRRSEHVYNEDTNVRSGLYVPLGEHGVLVAASTETGQFDENTAELAQLFATTAEAALDRIGRTQRLHDRERELKRQNAHLERLNETNEVRQEIEQLLLMADSRDEIERGICERVTDLEACSMAWIGDPDPSGNQLEPRCSAGREHGYLESVAVTTVDDSAAEPAGRAARGREPVSVENVADSVHDGAWRADALSRNFQSVFAVPLIYDGFLYGVLSIYGDEPDAFDDLLRSTLAELGETIAHTIDAVKRKTALLGDEVTEIELEIGGDSILTQLSDRLDAQVAFEGSTPRDDVTIVFASVDESIPADGSGLELDDVDGIVAGSIIETDDRTLIQLEVTRPFLDSIVTVHGGTIREFVATNGTASAVVDVPTTVDIREVVSTLNRRGITATLVARREQTDDDVPALDGSTRSRLLERLTERQREVVQTAYHSGFFEWPRRTTGEEIADSLDISPPAFHKHVRFSEQKLFDTIFESGSSADG